MQKHEIAAMLRSYGLRPSEIAASIYNVEWEKLPLSARRKLVNRVLGLIRYAENKFYDKHHEDFMTNKFYDGAGEDNIDDRGGVRDLGEWSPARDGTFNIYQRKRFAVSDEEKYFAEYERILYFFYERTISEYDDLSRSLWNRIVVAHSRIFKKYWPRYRRKISFDKTRLPEVIAAYVYIVFFASLYNSPLFYEAKHRLHKILKIFIRKPEKYEKHIEELLPLIGDFIL